MYGQLTKEPAYNCVKEDIAKQLAQGSWEASGHWRQLDLPHSHGVGTYRLSTSQEPFRAVPFERPIMEIKYNQAEPF